MKMDSPIFVNESYRQVNAESIGTDPDPDRIKQIELALLNEDTAAFVELINNSPSHFLDQESEMIWMLMFMWDSGKCAAAVLDGQTKITKEPLANSWLPKLDIGPLHYAAGSAAFKITTLLLQRGFSADVRLDYDRFDFQYLENVLPLHVVLARLRFHLLRFNPKEELSAIMLVLKLCKLSARGLLETLRLIALNTREVKREFFNYLQEGKMLEVGALLLVAKSQILSPSTAKEEGEFRSISEMHDFVLNTKCLLSTRLSLIKNIKLAEMEETLVLLKIFDKIGDKLGTLLRHVFTRTCVGDCSTLLTESLIEDAGFDVKYFYYNHSCTRNEVVSYFLKRAIDECGAIDECEKTIHTSDMLPSWVKAAALKGLRDKSGSASRLTYPFFAEALPYMNSVSMSRLTPRSAYPMLENMAPLYHLMKKTAPFLGMIKRVLRLRG